MITTYVCHKFIDLSEIDINFVCSDTFKVFTLVFLVASLNDGNHIKA